MSLRLISKSSTEKRNPLWIGRNGKPFYLPMGSAPDDDGDGSDDDDGDEDGDDGDDDDSDDGSEDRKKSKKSGDDEDEPVSKADLKKALERMKAADRRADAAEKKVKEFEKKDLTAIDAAKQEAKEAEEARKAIAAQLKTTRIENAFLASNKIAWHNPSRALQMADLSEVSIDEDGKVDTKALEKALENLAKSDAYLVKSKDDGDEGSGKSGDGVGSGRKQGSKNKIERDKLASKFPALAGRSR